MTTYILLTAFYLVDDAFNTTISLFRLAQLYVDVTDTLSLNSSASNSFDVQYNVYWNDLKVQFWRYLCNGHNATHVLFKQFQWVLVECIVHKCDIYN